MPYAPFHKLCPEIASRETRTVTVLPGANLGLEPADYEFVEMYCDEPGCDCRRVMFSVLSSARQRVEAVVAWGWESSDFYRRWFGMDKPDTIRQLKGPILNLASPQGPNASAILRLAQNLLLSDPAYTERLQRHYALFRSRVEATTRQRPPALNAPRTTGQRRMMRKKRKTRR